jgi:dephospho-CoA kinase
MALHPRTRSGHHRRRGPWKHGPIPVIGLIGGLGAGKSHAASALAERGCFVLDADAVGHSLLMQKPVHDQVVARFGTSILVPGTTQDGSPEIDRRALGAIVFASPAALRDLERILHPWMFRTFAKAIARAIRQRRARGVVLDAAILLEAGWDVLCDVVVFVDAPREQRVARLAAQRGWTEEILRDRERAQWPLEEKRRRADAVLANGADPAQFQAELDRFWMALRPPAPARTARDARRSSPEGRTRSARERASHGPAAAPPEDRMGNPR